MHALLEAPTREEPHPGPTASPGIPQAGVPRMRARAPDHTARTVREGGRRASPCAKTGTARHGLETRAAAAGRCRGEMAAA